MFSPLCSRRSEVDDVLEIRSLVKSFAHVPVINGVDFAVSEKSFTVVCGEPGNGKSVLARLICGLEEPDQGQILLDGKDITGVAPGARGIGYVPQSFALFPQYSVEANIGYPLRVAREAKAAVSGKVGDVAAMLGVQDILHKRVDQISGGEKQRVAMARGLVRESALYILDDPLVGLDFKLREQLTEDLRLLQQNLGATFLYFTSEPLEAMALADTVGILSGGRFVETADMPEAYLDPQHVQTALALGFPRANKLTAKVTRNGTSTTLTTNFFAATLHNWQADVDNVDLIVRPEDLSLLPREGMFHAAGDMELIEDLGGESIVYIRGGEEAQLLTVTTGSDAPELQGDIKGVWFDAHALMAFDPVTGQRISGAVGGDS
jgi:ABC-type sugar transport systems, ATPase components